MCFKILLEEIMQAINHSIETFKTRIFESLDLFSRRISNTVLEPNYFTLFILVPREK